MSMRKVRFRDATGVTRIGEWSSVEDQEIRSGNKSYHPTDVDVLPPTDPRKVICQAGGYRDHREESGVEEVPDRPELFIKTPNCVIGHNDTVELPQNRDSVEFEAEFAVVIGEQARDVSVDEAMNYVEGYTCVNDISNRDDQKKERNWVRGKSFDGSLPTGPVLSTPDEVPEDARLELRHNGEVKQETTTEHMIFSVEELVSEVSELITLEPGDLIATGTPFGPDRLDPGDVVEVEFEGVGTLRNEIIER